MHTYIRASVRPYEWLCSQIVFGNQEFIRLRPVPDESENSTSQNMGSFTRAPEQNFSFVENCPNDVITFQWRLYLSIELNMWYLNENNGTRTMGPNTKCQFSRNRLYRLGEFHC